MNIKRIFIICCCLIITGCSKQIGFPKIEDGIFSSKKQSFHEHQKITIITGDTLKSLSKVYKVSIREIIKYNNLKPPYILKPGKNLNIPKAVKYKIKKGDSLFKIAECANVNLEDIKQRNRNLKERKLVIGKFIKLPYFSNINNCKNRSASQCIHSSLCTSFFARLLFLPMLSL